MDNPVELRNNLSKFGPTQNLWRHAQSPWLSYTDGLKYFAEHAGCGGYWFIDAVATATKDIAKVNPTLHLKLTVAAGRAVLRATDGASKVPQMSPYRVPFTDCPLGEWDFLLISGVLMLPGEY